MHPTDENAVIRLIDPSSLPLSDAVLTLGTIRDTNAPMTRNADLADFFPEKSVGTAELRNNSPKRAIFQVRVLMLHFDGTRQRSLWEMIMECEAETLTSREIVTWLCNSPRVTGLCTGHSVVY